jgi:rRNA maturation endonuclease Nob1
VRELQPTVRELRRCFGCGARIWAKASEDVCRFCGGQLESPVSVWADDPAKAEARRRLREWMK